MPQQHYLAIDLGAESGRAVRGRLSEGRLAQEELHRWANVPVEVGGTLYWDLLSLYHHLLQGLEAAAGQCGESLRSVGVDSWSVDFGLLAADGSLLQNPVHYRDLRTEGMVEGALGRIEGQRLYELTGMIANQIHTVFQMLALREKGSPLLRAATTFLMIPDLLGYFLTGEQRVERTNASHTGLYDPRRGEWAGEVFARLELPIGLMPPLINPGTVLGEVLPAVRRRTGAGAVPVVAPCTHDTASAVAAAPAEGGSWAFLSSGTWSILGTPVDSPVTTPEALAARVNNELALEGPFACRNIMGLWLLQQCRAAWARGGRAYEYEELAHEAEQAPSGGPLVYPDDPSFLAPEDMPEAIAGFCRRSGQQPPQSPGEYARCILESLALCYRHDMDRLGELTGQRFEVLHVMGGGSRNALLCRLTAQALGLPVVAGPVEATVAGNLLVQALALGELSSPQEMRDVVRRSFELQEYAPGESAYMRERYGAYQELAAQSGAG